MSWIDLAKTAAPIVGSLLIGVAGTTAYHSTQAPAKPQAVTLNVKCDVPAPKPIKVEIVK